MVTHGNLLANLEMIRVAMSNTEHSASVGWVPLYHDMGLMMGVMQPLYLGAMSVLWRRRPSCSGHSTGCIRSTNTGQN